MAIVSGIPLYQVDAFAERPFHGNPAAVCLLTSKQTANLKDGVRHQIAAEMNLSETAFVGLPEDAPSGASFQSNSDFTLRWFTPSDEAILCGHATLASAAAIIYGEGNDSASLRFHTKFSGSLLVRRAADQGGVPQLEMDLPNDFPEAECPDWAKRDSPLLQAILKDRQALVQNISFNSRLLYLLIQLKDGTTREELEAIQPDIRKCLEAIGRDKIHMFILTAQSTTGEYDVVSRTFAPWSGIPEDPVTGSAHGVLGPWWAKLLGRSTLKARQCSLRGGDLRLAIEPSLVKISGPAKIVSKGELYVDIPSS